MITPDQLENLKLITDETVYLNEKKTLERVELAVQQGAGGWGVRIDDGAILKLARDLKIAASIAAESEATFNKMKGTQMENGRLKKQLSNVEDQLKAALEQLTGQEALLKVARTEVERLTDELHDVLGSDRSNAPND